MRQHPSETTRTIADCFSDEQPLLRPITAEFDGYVEHFLRVSSTCLLRVNRNNYSAPAVWVGKIVSVKVTADRLRVVADGDISRNMNVALVEISLSLILGTTCLCWKENQEL